MRDTEWWYLKRTVNKENRPVTKASWDAVNEKHKAEYRNILGLVDLLLSLPAHTADYERGCSLMISIQSDWRNRLGDNVVSSLMRIQMKLPSVCDYDSDDAIKLLLQGSQRKCSPFQAPYEKEEMDVCPSESDREEDLRVKTEITVCSSV
ncbi:hypothetical protein PR048_033716 [Dryococelus australis]|uniref:HAT C-terminal dimerisation domain-containing protein n=1 Tax=Dryococelus australis TaxID=614101 RepID=A0ABQ9G2A0_9NEOP|nr:hypothetical protein PR048_033716 [Dryococelus australis]